MAFGLVLLLGVLFLGAGLHVAGLDPALLAGIFAAGFILVGLFGVRIGIRQHRYLGRLRGRRRGSRTR